MIAASSVTAMMLAYQALKRRRRRFLIVVALILSVLSGTLFLMHDLFLTIVIGLSTAALIYTIRNWS